MSTNSTDNNELSDKPEAYPLKIQLYKDKLDSTGMTLLLNDLLYREKNQLIKKNQDVRIIIEDSLIKGKEICIITIKSEDIKQIKKKLKGMKGSSISEKFDRIPDMHVFSLQTPADPVPYRNEFELEERMVLGLNGNNNFIFEPQVLKFFDRPYVIEVENDKGLEAAQKKVKDFQDQGVPLDQIKVYNPQNNIIYEPLAVKGKDIILQKKEPINNESKVNSSKKSATEKEKQQLPQKNKQQEKRQSSGKKLKKLQNLAKKLVKAYTPIQLLKSAASIVNEERYDNKIQGAIKELSKIAKATPAGLMVSGARAASKASAKVGAKALNAAGIKIPDNVKEVMSKMKKSAKDAVDVAIHNMKKPLRNKAYNRGYSDPDQKQR